MITGWRRLIKPYVYSTIAIGSSAATGDFICQFLEHKAGKRSTIPLYLTNLPWWDVKRTLIMCSTGMLVTTPFSFTLMRTVEHVFPGKQAKQIAKKMLTNSLMAPIGISLAFTSITLMNGKTFEQAEEKVINDMPKTFLAGTCYWPFISFINFRFIPLDYRAFIGSLAAAVWNVYISSVANKQPNESTTVLLPTTRSDSNARTIIAQQQVPAN
ncbi:unnamed protein product [Didymodactylos carnosus]|uniref:Mitochondrial inner membrane protein Mpv17 n=1 Tax=Didymodactylos carnosus TaxID=1234261 RepID=A0A815C0W4_9BILA|nr:unnamed protein product [Didymodactylos carnosus]CAF1277705.1 unnamed protein product [Didymodactylos carnosus]CAF3967673.1 unnamed protein product [Didymodactylos carnosus]CAF4070680.1 unnamed protein product [Didymodactylos carnosus]